MKILMMFHTALYPPDLGPARRNFPFFLENMKRHEISVLSFGTPEQEKQFRDTYGASCNHIVFVNNARPRIFNFALRMWHLVTGRSFARWLYNATFERALQELLKKERFDLIHCCTNLFGYYRLPKNIPLVGDAHNVEFDNVYRAYQQTKNTVQKQYYYWNHLRLKQEETESSKKFDVVITTTDRDGQIYRQELPDKRICVIPNGVEAGFFQVQKVKEEPKTMVFTGLMSYLPNYHGITYFLDMIFPLILEREPQARILIVGANPPKKLRRRATGNVIVTGWVDDVKPYFARGQVFVIPLLIGGGIRGKALEAMAMKRPIVTTTLGCEGINLKHEDSAFFADTPKDFADAVVLLFNDPALRKRLTDKAYHNVLEGYSWESSGFALDNVYQSLVSLRGVNGSNGTNARTSKRVFPTSIDTATE